MRKSTPLVRDTDRMAAAAYMVDQLRQWMYLRTLHRRQVDLGDAWWEHECDPGAGIHSEAPALFPGRRSAWVR